MRVWILLMFAVPATAQQLSLERVFSRPEGRLPRRFAFSPDGKRLTYLLAREGELSDLWSMDLESGERTVLVKAEGKQKLTEEEKAARERRRERGTGVTSYTWQPKGDAILIPRSGDLYLWRGRMNLLVENARDARWSPDGKRIAFVRKKNLWVIEVDTKRQTQLTTWGGGTKRCGQAEFIAMEELGRHRGFWWAPDSKRIAYVRTDETGVPSFQIPNLLHERNEPQRQIYPRAGDPNVKWTLHVTGSDEALPIADEYLVRVDWEGDLYVQTASRAQTRLRLWKNGKVVHEEIDPAWVRFHHDFRLIDGRLLWPSEKSGWRHLYLDGKPLTSGEWDVASVVGVDEARVYFLANERIERKLYAVGLDGTRTLLTPEPGFHSVTMSDDARWIVDTWSRVTQPPRIVLRDNTGRIVREIARGKPVEGLVEAQFIQIPAGSNKLQAMLLRRERETPGPALVYTYAGPGSHIVWDRWGGTSALWHQRMVQRGYAVLMVDGRGTSGYGRDFCRVVDRRLCHWEVKDQASAAHWLGRMGWVDPKRIAIWGWSYGGTMTLQCLQEAPDVFAAGISVAPVTDWHDYDTAYTERYLGLPEDNPTNYRLSSPLYGAHKLDRPLLLAHGMKDDNVHFRNAVTYVDRVQKAGKLIEMDFYPRGKHGIGGKHERLLLFRRMERFLDREIGRGK
ncbi:MAG: DPP IV N-terminal domain-containing protein [Planctomycetota bacterium]|jgi:dipeptidyl-peptidase-4